MSKGFYHDKETVSQYIEMAKDVNSEELIEKFKNYLPKDSTVLELGSGPGTDWNILRRYFNVTGSDYSEEFISRLRSIYPEGNFVLLDATNPETEIVYDGIYSNKVLIHLNDSELNNSILRQSQILKKGGYICHSFWKGEGTENYNGLFVNNQTAESLEKLFSIYFNIIVLEEYKEFEDNDSLLLIGEVK